MGRNKAKRYPAKAPEPERKRRGVRFIVSREFAGSQTMQQAFEQLIERQTCERFEEWMGKKPVKRLKSGEKQLKGRRGHGTIIVSCPCS